ncbi:AAA family ATPase [Candidatus Micrarchaeota archaeon]|nr:AAA family ATPase [Candidatus Micrarchaeota archaeon]
MIRSLRLINWRSHKDTRLEFRKGTNLLVGIMGAGKSSVLEGITFALYGTFPALERRKIRLEHLIRLNEQSATVILEFEFNGSLYKIERTIEKKTSAELFKDGQLVEHGTVPVTRYLSDLLQADYDLFTRAVLSEQNNIEHFLNLDPRRRKEELDNLLGLDRFENARSTITTVITRIKTERQALESQFSLAGLQEQQEKEKQHLQKISGAEARLKQEQELLKSKTLELSSYSSAFEKMQKEKEQSELIEREIIRLSAQYESLQKEVREVDEEKLGLSKSCLRQKLQEKTVLSESLKKTNEKTTFLSKQLGSIQSEIASSEKSLEKSSKIKTQLSELLDGHSIQSLQSKQKELEQSILQFQSDKTSAEQSFSEVSDLLARLKPGTSQCPLCLSQISELSRQHIRAEKERFLGQKKSRITELSAILEKNQQQNIQLKEKMQKISELSSIYRSIEIRDTGFLRTEAAKITEELRTLAEQMVSLEKQIETISAEAEKLRQEISNSETILKKAKQMEQLSEELSKAKKKAISFDKQEFEELRKKTESLRLEIERTSSAISSIDSEKKLSLQLLELVVADIRKLQMLQSEISRLSSTEEQLSIYRNALLETQTSLRSSLSEAITEGMNELWHIFYPYHNYKALRLKVTDKDYLFEVDDGQWKPIDLVASGGEKATAALTLRVALAMVLTPNLSWLILDEPTHNLDSTAVEMLSSALQLKVPEVVNQIFLVTHDEAFMGSEFAMSYKLSREKQNNGETKIEII